MELIPIISLVLIILLLVDKQIFRRFITTILLSTIISVPLWLTFPALAPSWLYWENIYSFPLKQELISPEITNYQPSPYLTQCINHLKDFWIDKKHVSYPVTSNPSMHTAWSIELAYYATMLWKPFGLIAIPFALVTITSTLYTLEHYFADIILGTLIALIVICLTEWLFKQEEKKKLNLDQYFYFIDILQADLKLFMSWSLNYLKKITSLFKR